MKKVLLLCSIFILSLTIGSVTSAQQSYVGCKLRIARNYLNYRTEPLVDQSTFVGTELAVKEFEIIEERSVANTTNSDGLWVKVNHTNNQQVWMSTFTGNTELVCDDNQVTVPSVPSTVSVAGSGTISFLGAEGLIHSVAIGYTCPRNGYTWDTTVIWSSACYAASFHYPDRTNCLIVLGHTGVSYEGIVAALNPISELGPSITQVSLTYEGVAYSFTAEYFDHYYPKSSAQSLLGTYCRLGTEENPVVPTVIVQFSNPVVAETDPNYALFTQTVQVWVGRMIVN